MKIGRPYTSATAEGAHQEEDVVFLGVGAEVAPEVGSHLSVLVWTTCFKFMSESSTAIIFKFIISVHKVIICKEVFRGFHIFHLGQTGQVARRWWWGGLVDATDVGTWDCLIREAKYRLRGLLVHNTKNNSRKAFKLIPGEKQIVPEHLLIWIFQKIS